jgi:hypothetical protein
MFFPIITTDKIVQVGDRFRILADKSFQNGNDPVISVLIKPGASESFYQAYNALDTADKSYWYLDWSYATSGAKTVELQITYGPTLTPTVKTSSFSVQCVTEAEDYLFSSDADLIGYQHDIMKYLPEHRSSWIFVHRITQKEILDYLDQKGRVNADGSKITKDQIVDLSEVRATATFKTLRIIYESMSNAPDDFFMKRAGHWRKYEEAALLKCVDRIDFDKNGTIEDKEIETNVSILAVRV